MRYGQSHRRTLIGVECFLSNGAILSDLGAIFKVKPGDSVFPVKKKYPSLNVCMLQRPPTKMTHMFLPHEKLAPGEKLPRQILALAEICAL